MADKDQKAGSIEWCFRIDAFRPETLPMARLAEYLTQLAVLLNEARSVHLVRIEGGSTVLVHEIDEAAVSNVEKRVDGVRDGIAPAPATDAFDKMNRYLVEDDATATLHRGGATAHVLEFPGSTTEINVPAVKQTGTVSGVVVRVGGVGKRIPVLLQSQGRQTTGCHADKETAKELGRYLFEPVRLYGDGQWRRTADGAWEVDRFRIARFSPLDKGTLSEVLAKLRPVAANWGDEAYEDLESIAR